MKRAILSILAVMGLLGPISGLEAKAASRCDQVHLPIRLNRIIEKPPFEQWLIWEQEANLALYRKSRAAIQVQTHTVPNQEVNVTFMKSASPALRNLISQGEQTRWFSHPYNTVDTLPYFGAPATGSVDVYLTASRSLAIKVGQEFYTLKMGTDRPHGPQGERQRAKASTKEDILDGINRMSYIERVDSQIGVDPALILAKEVAMVAEKKTGEGYLFRDLSFMKSGNYYLPALSIPYAGREIAKFNGVAPEVFWKSAYAELLGRSKAKLLLRYGAQMETPNSQNMLIELDRNLRPTGRLVFRDISDTMLVKSIVEGLGEHEVWKSDQEMGVENTQRLQPFWRNSSWRFDEAGDLSFSHQVIGEWGAAHDQAYRAEIEKALDVDLSRFQQLDHNLEFDVFMASDIVKKKLQDYRKLMIEKHQKSIQRAG